MQGLKFLSGARSRLFSTVNPKVKEQVTNKLGSSKVVMYSKTSCKFCKNAKKLLNSANITFERVEIDRMKEGKKVLEHLTSFTNMKTVPQIFIGGNILGGYSELKQAFDDGSLSFRIQTQKKTLSHI
jgi:glutaredoxin